MNTRRNRPDYFLLNDGIDEEASPEDRLDSSRTYHKSTSFSLSRSQRSSLAPLQEPPRRPDFQNLHPLTSLGHTLTYLNLKIRGWLRKATKEES
ncbi:hypothetical protein POJ06DRAFT_259594 [Lipomyces tetrasporus]|uniref:Uncharacterized protein n=1 Tax=Lipomyces tetrasporus TaxID=54092 RepID=A0AAD7VRU3_9ASCO|nr:uncharacterized protein POJ06DRAFT_259594 [Lipomyces tetrasporus]KAJ8098485.1 hypothetical protein POJ06DRAFT_259594 [Lipomyces tetrasporus]